MSMNDYVHGRRNGQRSMLEQIRFEIERRRDGFPLTVEGKVVTVDQLAFVRDWILTRYPLTGDREFYEGK
jgi:hypothetical protein